MSSNDLEKQFKMYSELAMQDKNIDVAKLMAAALEKSQASSIPAGQKRWAYFISVGAPPFGLVYALKFWFSGKDDGKNTALVCVVLTVLSVVFLMALSSMLLSGSGVSSDQLQQIQNIKPDDIRQLYE